MEAELNKSDNKIQLKKDSIFRVEIFTSDGKSTNQFLEFDLEDIELPLRLNKCEIEHKKNAQALKFELDVIEKKQDKKGKYLLSWKDEEKIKAFQNYYDKEMKTLDLFLGEGGTKKLLNGRKPYYTMYNDIAEILEPIMPKLKLRADDITNKIKEKYSVKEDNVLE